MADIITNGELFQVCHSSRNLNKSEKTVMSYLSTKLCNIINLHDDEYENVLKKKVITFCHHLRVKWKSSSRNVTTFQKKHHVWLQTKFKLPEELISSSDSKNIVTPNTSHGPGKPLKDFASSSFGQNKEKFNI